MKTVKRDHTAKRTLSTQRETGESGGSLAIRSVVRQAVGYVRVSTDMQAAEGLSVEAQQAAIEGYCAMHGVKLVRICKDVMSGGKDQRSELQEELSLLQNRADIFVLLNFDRLSRSIKHFCNSCKCHFRLGEKEPIAIQESIQDHALPEQARLCEDSAKPLGKREEIVYDKLMERAHLRPIALQARLPSTSAICVLPCRS